MRNHRSLKVLVALAVSAAGLIPSVGAVAAADTPSSVSSGSLAGLRYHVVVAGDSVGSIARTYGVSSAQIRVVNGLVGERLYLGARVLIDPANPTTTAKVLSGQTAAPAAPAATSPPAATTSSDGGTYVVKEGDMLERIARKFGVKLSSLLAANGLEATSVILPGRKLAIPTGTGGTTGSASPGSAYVVKEGDMLERIARKFGVKLSSLLAANGLEATSVILPGRKLTIPAGGSSSAPSAAPAAAPAATTAASTTPSWIGPKIVCPVPGATFMNDWGFPRGDERFHEGTDMFAPKGTTIVAPVSGFVSFGSNGLGGTTFNITTPDGWEIYGAHLSATIGEGGQVAAGTPIGRVGNTGDADGGDTHLHLGIRPSGGRPANAYPSVLAACG